MSSSGFGTFIGPDSFVAEIRKRPVLYDPRLGNNNMSGKRRAWEEIGEMLFDGWERFSAKKKDSTVKEMQVKWRSMRDGLARALRKDDQDEANGVPHYKRKKYVYYNDLEFLIPFIVRRTVNNVAMEGADGIMTMEQEDVKVPIEFDNSQSPSDSMDEPLTTQAIQFVSVSRRDPVEDNPLLEDAESDSLGKATLKVLNELVALQKGDDDDPMGNKKFLLSLMPFMKKLPDDANLEVRLQLLNVLQTYTSRKFSNS